LHVLEKWPKLVKLHQELPAQPVAPEIAEMVRYHGKALLKAVTRTRKMSGCRLMERPENSMYRHAGFLFFRWVWGEGSAPS